MQETLRLGGRRPDGAPAPPPARRPRSRRGARASQTGPLGRAERRSLVERLRADGARIAERFGLRYQVIEAENARVKRRYGSCHSDGVIKIRLTHAKTGRPLKYSSMIDTLCHELAHLKFFHHGPRFRDFYEVVLDWARREGIYRPGRRPKPAAPPLRPTPKQMPLF
jgi:predicted metal-dependent hydrolase